MRSAAADVGTTPGATGSVRAYAGRWRAAYAAVAIAAAATVVYGSFVPFDFRAPHGTDATGLAFPSPSMASRTDFVSNVLLFLPGPFALMGALCAGRGRRSATAVAAVLVPLFTVAVAWSVEWGQQFLPSRTPSWYDVLAAATASCVAVTVWLAVGDRVTDWLHRAIAGRQPRTFVETALVLYAAGTAVLQVLPLDLTIRPAELAEKYRAGRIVLTPLASLLPLGLDALLAAFSTLLRSVPFGLLGLVLWMPASTIRRPVGAFVLGLGAVAAIEAAQIFVFSRVFDVTDVLVGAAGVATGSWAGRRAWSHRTAAAPASVATSWAIRGLAAWLLILLVRHWYPFDFSLDPALIRSRLPEVIGVPFRAYYTANPFEALNDAAIKGLLAVPVGLLLWRCWPPRSWPTVPAAIRLTILLAVSTVFFTAVEAGQLLLPSRYPDITDVGIGMAGTAVGLALMSRFGHAPASRV